MSEPGNLFALEPLLVRRLTEALPAGVQVLTAPYLEDLRDLEQYARRLPAVFVMHLDGDPVAGPRPLTGLRLQQRWAVVVATHNRADLPSGAAARLQAGELAWGALNALHGWRPLERARSLDFSRLLAPLFIKGGLQLLPLVFTHETPRLCGD